MKHLLTIILILILFPTPALAGDGGSCRIRVNQELARELRLYRSVLFGKSRAEDADIGNVRYDIDGNAWIKTSEESTPWINSVNRGSILGLEWSNEVMDEEDEHADSLPLVGIFETKRVTTSEMIPYLLQSIRAVECRMISICEVVSFSEGQDDESPVEIEELQAVGCVKFQNLNTLPECHLAVEGTSATRDQADAKSYCDKVVKQTMLRERELLKLTVEYDAGYRTLLQFAGNFDVFLKEMRWPLANTMRKAVQLIGQLDRIPCFLASCDSSPPIKTQ